MLMEEQTIQTKIKTAFINAVSTSSAFTAKEIEEIYTIISSTQKAEKMAENLLKAIGGTADEDT
jgi:hypothetical protein